MNESAPMGDGHAHEMHDAQGTQDAQLAHVWDALDRLSDPEIPVVSLREMGILRAVSWLGESKDAVEVVITPTYSGCPAMEQIHDDIRAAVQALGLPVTVRTQLAPAWTTDWMSPSTHDKLRAYGIAPPTGRCASNAPRVSVMTFMRQPVSIADAVPCPQCGSANTVETSRFASTACKALYKCLTCQEPFDYFKPY